MAETQVQQVIRRWRDRKAKRSPWENHWDDLARVQLTRRMGFLSETTPGDRRTDSIFDGTPMQAARGLANAIGGMIRPDGQKWVFMKAADDAIDGSDEAKEWFEAATKELVDAMMSPRARFRQATGEADIDLVVFGTAALFEGEQKDKNGLLFQSLHLKDAVVSFSEEGVADGMFREKPFTLSQAEARFGKERLSPTTQRNLEAQKFDDKITILHAVLERRDGRADAPFARNLPFASMWIEVESAHEVSQGGFHEFPFIVPRWDTSSGEDYGRSPGMIALPDSNTLQAMGETILIAGQRAAAPPLLVPNDGFFDEANAFPDGITYYDAELASQMGRMPIGPLESATNLPISRDMQKDVREQVFAAFFRNVLNLPIDGPEMTATEVIHRKEEFIREIGPVFGRLETDYTAPMVERAFNIMLRANALPEIPEILQGQDIRFEYESPIKKIRQQVEATAAQLWVQEQISISAVKPEQLDIVDLDEYARFAAEAAQIPTRLVVDREIVQAIREARAEQEAAQQQAQDIAQGVEVAAKAKDIPGVQEMVQGAA